MGISNYPSLCIVLIFACVHRVKSFESLIVFRKPWTQLFSFADSIQRQYNFHAIIKDAADTKVYTPAVHEAYSYLSEAKLSESGITSVIRIFGLAGLVDDAVKALWTAKERGIILNNVHINAAMTVCNRHKRYSSTVNLFQKIYPSMLLPDVQSVSCMIKACGELKEIDSAVEVFNKYSTVNRDIILYGNLLSALEKNNKLREVLDLFDNITAARSVRLSPHVFNVVMSVYGKLNDYDNVDSTYTSMVKFGILPDDITTHTYMRLMRRAKQWDKIALQKQSPSFTGASEMTSTSRLHNETTFSTRREESYRVADAHRGTNSGTVMRKAPFGTLLREAKRSGDCRDAVTAADLWLSTQNRLSPGGVTSCINIYGLAGNATKVMSVLSLMLKRNYEPNVVQLNALMAALVRCSRPQQALDIFYSMQISGSQEFFADSGKNMTTTSWQFKASPDHYSYGSALLALERMGCWQAACALFDWYSASVGGPMAVPTVLHNSLLHILGKVGQWSVAVDRYSTMREPDSITHFTMLSILDRALASRNASIGNTDQQLSVAPESGTIVDWDQLWTLRQTFAEKVEKRSRFVPVPNNFDTKAGFSSTDSNYHAKLELPVSENTAADTSEVGTQIVLQAIAPGTDEGSSIDDDSVQLHHSEAGTLEEKLRNHPAGQRDLMKALGAVGRAREIIDLLDAAERAVEGSDDRRLSTEMYNTAIKACGLAGDANGALGVFHRMSASSVRRDSTTYRQLLTLLRAVGAEAAVIARVEQQGRLDGILPSDATAEYSISSTWTW